MPNTLPAVAPEPSYAAFVALDWGSQKHAWILQPAGSGKPEQGVLDNTPEAVAVWAAELEQRYGGRPVAVAVEQKRGPVVNLLLKYAHLVVYPVPPSMSASYRQAFVPSGAKDDPGDAGLTLDLLLRHRDRLRRLEPDNADTRLLQFLVEDRRQTVDEKTRQVLRLQDCLKQYFPQVLKWFGDVDKPLVAALLDRWPNLQHLQHAHPGTLSKFFHEQHCRGEERIQQRIDAIYAATPATTDPAVLEACALKARGLTKLIAALRDHITAIEQRRDELVAAHPDSAVFASFPGAGPATVPRLIAAFGTRRERYPKAYDVQCGSGIAPVYIASGKSKRVSVRRACPKFLRQTFHEFAGQSIAHCPWAKAYYQHQQRDLRKDHHAAVRTLAYKWIRILFRCWKDGKPYDEQRYLESLRRRGALLGELAPATGIQWKTVGGFQKLSMNPS
jgi:transposase